MERGLVSGGAAAVLVALGGTASAAGRSALTPPGNVRPVLTLHATGTQDYLCLPKGSGSASGGTWVFVRPQAVLTSATEGGAGSDLAEHALLAVPGAASTAAPGCTEAADGAHEYCPSWRSPTDGSVVWGSKVASETAGRASDCPNRGAVSCLLLRVVATAGSPGVFSPVRYVQRVRTVGGGMPLDACRTGAIEQVPYSADYVFFGP